MTTAFDPSSDFARVTDGLVRVVIVRAGTPTEVPVEHALRRAVRTREARKSGGRYTASNVVWYLPVAELPESPMPGDVLAEEAGRRWTVLDVQQTAVGSCWRCVCRALAIARGLDQE
ncbi:MAG: hypothetical protein HUU20_26710, partial [Pirellulales bacterium]|nr:hypothetical protein [Pirellulales bacterium]